MNCVGGSCSTERDKIEIFVYLKFVLRRAFLFSGCFLRMICFTKNGIFLNRLKFSLKYIPKLHSIMIKNEACLRFDSSFVNLNFII